MHNTLYNLPVIYIGGSKHKKRENADKLYEGRKEGFISILPLRDL